MAKRAGARPASRQKRSRHFATLKEAPDVELAMPNAGGTKLDEGIAEGLSSAADHQLLEAGL
eukprot:4678283-Prymnesium_polylepis.1